MGILWLGEPAGPRRLLGIGPIRAGIVGPALVTPG